LKRKVKNKVNVPAFFDFSSPLLLSPIRCLARSTAECFWRARVVSDE